MRYIVTTVFALALSAAALCAQNTFSVGKDQYQLRLSIGGRPVTAANHLTGEYSYNYNYYSSDEQLGKTYQNYRGPVRSLGNIMLEGSMGISEKWYATFSLGFCSLWYNNYSGVTNEKLSHESGTALYVLPGIRRKIAGSDIIRCYAFYSLGLGKYLGFDSLSGWTTSYSGQKSWHDESLQAETEVGLSMDVGRGPWIGIVQVGVGTLYNGGSVGVGYRF